jgi:hypothetical protein
LDQAIHHDWLPAIAIASEFIAILILQVNSIRKYLRRIAAIRPKNRQLAHHYAHLAILCKDPGRCRRCLGWWTGFAMIVAIPGGLLVGLGNPIFIPQMIGLNLTLVGCALGLSATPVHGTIGRMMHLGKNHWTENPILTFCFGILFAFGIACGGEAIIFALGGH